MPGRDVERGKVARAAWAARGLVGLALLAVAPMVGCGSPNQPLEVAKHVDLSRFQGKWYEIGLLPKTSEADCHGTMAFYTLAADGSLGLVNQCALSSQTGPLYTVEMKATVPDVTVPAKLALQVGGFSGDYWILEVGANYEYAVIGHPSRAYWWLLSRTPTLDATVMKDVIDRGEAEGFDLSTLQYTAQPPAADRATLDAPEGPLPTSVQTGCSMSGHGRRQPALAWFGGALALAGAGLARRSRRGGGKAPR